MTPRANGRGITRIPIVRAETGDSGVGSFTEGALARVTARVSVERVPTLPPGWRGAGGKHDDYYFQLRRRPFVRTVGFVVLLGLVALTQ